MKMYDLWLLRNFCSQFIGSSVDSTFGQFMLVLTHKIFYKKLCVYYRLLLRVKGETISLFSLIIKKRKRRKIQVSRLDSLLFSQIGCILFSKQVFSQFQILVDSCRMPGEDRLPSSQYPNQCILGYPLLGVGRGEDNDTSCSMEKLGRSHSKRFKILDVSKFLMIVLAFSKNNQLSTFLLFSSQRECGIKQELPHQPIPCITELEGKLVLSSMYTMP